MCLAEHIYFLQAKFGEKRKLGNFCNKYIILWVDFDS